MWRSEVILETRRSCPGCLVVAFVSFFPAPSLNPNPKSTLLIFVPFLRLLRRHFAHSFAFAFTLPSPRFSRVFLHDLTLNRTSWPTKPPHLRLTSYRRRRLFRSTRILVRSSVFPSWSSRSLILKHQTSQSHQWQRSLELRIADLY